MDVKRAPAPRAPMIHLTSTAAYTRPAMAADLPLQSTHRASYSAGPADMARRCLEAMRTARSHNMIRDASHLLPLDLVDAHDAEVAAHFAGETRRELAERAALALSKAEQHAPTATAAEAALATLLESQPRHGMQNKLVKTDFTGGSTGGPFPGSQSQYGKHQSECYWQNVKAAASGRLKTQIPDRLAPNGERLKNHNCAYCVAFAWRPRLALECSPPALTLLRTLALAAKQAWHETFVGAQSGPGVWLRRVECRARQFCQLGRRTSRARCMEIMDCRVY